MVYTGSERFCSHDGGAIVDEGQPEAPHVGRTIDGRYLVRRLVGMGGMGAVYEADHVGLDRRVAIKFIRHDDRDQAARARFRREARAASRVVHEHVVQIFDIGTDADGTDYLVMEYLEGRDLRELIAAGPVEPARAVQIARQMLLGLGAIHDAGIVHRDIKPANVLLTRGDEFAKIMDFGIAKPLDQQAETLTGTGRVIGTPEYMAPEQHAGAEVDHRADLYAVGITLYEMLAGRMPFVATTFLRLAEMHLREMPRPIEEVCRNVPPSVVAALARSLEKEPARRFATAADFARALDGEDVPRSAEAGAQTMRATPKGRLLEAAARQLREGEPKPRSRRTFVAVVLTCALCAGVALGLVGLQLRNRDRAAAVEDAAKPAPIAAPASGDAAPTVVANVEPAATVDAAPATAVDARPAPVAPTPVAPHPPVRGEPEDATSADLLRGAAAAQRASDWPRAIELANTVITGEHATTHQRHRALVIHGTIACSALNNYEAAKIDLRKLASDPRLAHELLAACKRAGVDLGEP